MLFEYPLTIPANTAEAAPTEDLVALAPGTISRVEVQFPRGCVGLVHVQVWRSEHQVWPTNVDGSIAGENTNIIWPEAYDLDDEPYDLTLRGWSDDDSFPHKITFRFAVLPLSLNEAAREHGGLLRRIADFLGLGA